MEHRIRTAVKSAVGLRNYQRARARALTRLAQLHNEKYRQFLEEEKERDEMEGKKWHSLSGSPSPSLDSTRKSSGITTSEGKEDRNEGNDGGEA